MDRLRAFVDSRHPQHFLAYPVLHLFILWIYLPTVSVSTYSRAGVRPAFIFETLLISWPQQINTSDVLEKTFIDEPVRKTCEHSSATTELQKDLELSPLPLVPEKQKCLGEMWLDIVVSSILGT